MVLAAPVHGGAGTRQRSAGDASSTACQAGTVWSACAAPAALKRKSTTSNVLLSPKHQVPIHNGPKEEDNSPIMSLANQDIAMVSTALQSPIKVNQPKDLICCLPLHLSLFILGLLDQKSLEACAAVSRRWALLVKEVKRECVYQSKIQEKVLYFQGLCPRGAISNYAKIVDVTIPQLNKKGDVIKVEGYNLRSKTKMEDNNLQAAYHGLKTDKIQLEERNVFCCSYNVHVLMGKSDQSRVIHYSGGNLVAIGSADRKVRLLGLSGVKEVPPVLSGHAGSIKALFLNEKKGFILSASFNLIRCWNIYSGACVKIFNGHHGTVTCLDLHEKQFVSGAKDGLVKVWNLENGKCLKTLRHRSAVWAVKMNGTHVVSGSDQGLVKVWCAATGTLIKILEGHQGPVKCLSFDQWHLVTGSTDGYVLGWSMLGNHKRCLIAFHHPKEVLSLDFHYLRVISGCADGKIRIFNYLNGSCLKVLKASSRGDPISSFCVAGNRMVINSPSSLLVFQFKDVQWDYTLGADREKVQKSKHHLKASSRSLPHPQQAQRDHSQLHRHTRETQALHCEQMKSAACLQQQHFLKTEKPFCIQKEPQRKLLTPALTQTHAFTSGKPTRAPSARTLADSKSKHGPSFYAPAHPARAEATLQHEKTLSSMSIDKLLLTINTWQNTCKAASFSSVIKHTAGVGTAWEPGQEHQQHHSGKGQTHKTPLQYREDQTVQLQRARLHSDSLTMKVISVPFETKMLRLKLKNSLHGPSVKSSIPAPSVVRPKTCSGLLREKKAHTGHSKMLPVPEDRVQIIDPFTAASELTKSTHVMIAQMKKEVVSGRKNPFCPYAAGPLQNDSGFRLLTGKQKEVSEAATVAQYWAHQTKLREDQQKACKKAWLRKVKGLPVDYFTGEGKIDAPELGFNIFI